VYERTIDLAKYDHIYVSCSGGKDSVAAALLLKKMGVPFTCIFYDVGWEHPDTYGYIDQLEGIFGKITRLRAEIGWPKEIDTPYNRIFPNDKTATATRLREYAAGRFARAAEEIATNLEAELGVPYSAFVRLILRKRMFPKASLKFCTQELKLAVAAKFFKEMKDLYDTEAILDVVGIRAEESASRAEEPVYEYDPALGVSIWRPVHSFTLQQVIDLHAEFGLAPNPLYLRRSRRVGCWPCILAGADELAALDEHRLKIIVRLEAAVADLQDLHNELRGEQRIYAPPTLITRVPPGMHEKDVGEFGVPNGYRFPIRDAVAHARSDASGRQLTEEELRQRLPQHVGCARWGLCAKGEEVP
jgi:3'-phosphoadenosine 5'-phosphosulfate sulfotransferase (PAPS reductase)/FAD synthetase